MREFCGKEKVYNIANSGGGGISGEKHPGEKQTVIDSKDFHYNPRTGELWKLYSNKSQLISSVNSGGYITVKYKGHAFVAHRIIWFLHYGYWPEEIDHINRDKADNHIENLRECTRSQNQANKPNIRNSDIRGVRLRENGKWQARVRINNKLISFGCHNTRREAAEKYNIEALKLFGKFAILNDLDLIKD
jgi:HNH endonuclease